MVFSAAVDGGAKVLRGQSSPGVVLAVLSFVFYVATTLAMPWTWDTQYCCEQNSFAVATSRLLYETPLGTMRRQVADFFMTHLSEPLGQLLVDVQSLPEPETGAPEEVLRTTFDGNGIGYPLVATAAFGLFGLHAWAPLLTMLLLMALAATAFLQRFGAARAYVVTVYFVALTALLFTAIVWRPAFRTQIPVGGIRYFSLVAVLPTLHILLHLFAREAVDPRVRRRNYALLGVQAAILTIAVLVRSSAASLFAAIAIVWLVQLWRSDRLLLPLGNAAVVAAVVAGLGIMLALIMPEEYRTEGRIGTVVWHRVVISLGLNPAFPFPGLNDFADCRKLRPQGLHRGLLDENGWCIWADYQIRHGLPIDGTGLDLFNGEYDTVLEKQFFRIALRYPGEVLATFLYYKPQMLLQSMGTALATNFANDPKPAAGPDEKHYVPYPGLAVGLLIAALALCAIHLVIAGAALTGLAEVAGVALWAALWAIPPYLVAWAYPMTIVDLTLYCLFLVALAFAGFAAALRRLAGGYRRSAGVPV